MMFSNGYFAFVNRLLCYFICSVQVGCLLTEPTSLKLTAHIMYNNTKILCDITGLQFRTLIFYENENQTLFSRRDRRYCGDYTFWYRRPKHAFCGCTGNTAYCNIYILQYKGVCPKWRCSVIMYDRTSKYVTHDSNYVEVCNSNSSEKMDSSNCFDSDTSGSVEWIIWGLNIKHYMLISILKTYTAANISSFIAKYTSYQHASISACTLKKHESEDWNLSILDSSLLCSSNSNMSDSKTCNATDGNPMVTVIREPNITSQCQSIRPTPAPAVLTLCDAVNRKDAGAQHFVGNMTGLFKLEILVRASLIEFFVEGFNNQTHITFNDTTKVTFHCRGDGFPPPTMQLFRNDVRFSVGYSPLRPTMTLNGSQDAGNYTCIAENALGEDSKTIHVSCQISINNYRESTHLQTNIMDKSNGFDSDSSSRVEWTILGLNIKHNMLLSILNTYTEANISSFIAKYTSYQPASISACTLKKHKSDDWNLSILDSSLLCSSNSNMSVSKTCNVTDGNPIVTVITEPNIKSQCQSIWPTPAPAVLTLCEAVNRKDAGAQHFVGNMTGLFKLEIFVRASVIEFLMEGFNNQTHITFNDTTKVTFHCRGDGFPPPTMQLFKNDVRFSVGYSPLRPTMTLSGSHDTGKYTCVAENALGEDIKTMHVSCQIRMDNHQDQPPDAQLNKKLIEIILGGTGSLVLLIITVAVACVYRIYKRMNSTNNVVLPMHIIATTTATTSSMSSIDQSVIYHEIDPQLIDSDSLFGDGGSSNIAQFSVNAAAVRNEELDHLQYGDESQYLTVIAD